MARGAGECAREVTEQFALGKALGQGRAIHVDQRLVRPRRAVVDRPRHQLLARTGLAQDQHRELAPCHGLDLLVQRAHRRAAADQRRGRPQLLEQRVAHEMLAFDRCHQPRLLADDGEARSRELGRGTQGLDGSRMEGARAQCIDGERTQRAVRIADRHAHAVVHVQAVLAVRDQAVERVWQQAVRREAHRVLGP